MYQVLNKAINSAKDYTITTTAISNDIKTLADVLKHFMDKDSIGLNFRYQDTEFQIKENKICTKEKFIRGDSSQGEEEDLFEWIDTCNLDEPVILTGYTIDNIKEGEIEYNNDIISSATPYSYHFVNNKEVRCCPVCSGRGFVSGGFYSSTGNTWVSSTTTPDTCRTCCGKGYITL